MPFGGRLEGLLEVDLEASWKSLWRYLGGLLELSWRSLGSRFGGLPEVDLEFVQFSLRQSGIVFDQIIYSLVLNGCPFEV